MSSATKFAGLAEAADDLSKGRKKKAAGGKKSGGGDFMGLFSYFPLLAIPVVVYNLVAWVGPLFGGAVGRMTEPLLSVPMPSVTRMKNAAGEVMTSATMWDLTPGDLLLALALILLFFELLKSTNTGRSSITNHALSLFVMLVCLVEFLIFPAFSTSVFFLITLMALLDVIAGFIVTIVTARRDIAVGEGFE